MSTKRNTVGWLCLLAGLLIAAPAHADALRNLGEHLSGADLIADVTLLEQAYTELHPGLYRYATPAQVARRFADLRRQLRAGARLDDTYVALSRFSAGLRCGHTHANIHNQSAPVQQALLAAGPRLPFFFRWLDARMVVTRDSADNAQLAPGTEVLRIDGIPVRRLLHRLLTIARADGGNDGKRVALLEVQGHARIETFDLFLPLLFPGLAADGHFTLQVRGPGQAPVRQVRVRGLSHDERAAMVALPARDADTPAWTLAFPETDLAVLRMPDWALYDSRWDWRSFLDASFTRLIERRTPALVIDLRGNEGGLGVGDVLLSRLLTAPLTLPPVLPLVRYRRVPAALRPHLDTWDDSFADWGEAAVAHDDRYFRLTRWQREAIQRIEPVAPRYPGRVFVLVGAANSSATFEFARAIKASGAGLLVGQATGGNRRGINGGAFFFLRLPHSGLAMDLPLIGQFPTVAQPDAGIVPDLTVTVQAADIAAGRDVELAAVHRLLAVDNKEAVGD